MLLPHRFSKSTIPKCMTYIFWMSFTHWTRTIHPHTPTSQIIIYWQCIKQSSLKMDFYLIWNFKLPQLLDSQIESIGRPCACMLITILCKVITRFDKCIRHEMCNAKSIYQPHYMSQLEFFSPPPYLPLTNCY